MRHPREGEVPRGSGTAVQEDPERPVFRGNGPYDYRDVDTWDDYQAVLAEAGAAG